jgi:hypothetical protein
MTEYYYIKNFILCYFHNSIREEFTYYHLKILLLGGIDNSLDNISEILVNNLRF